MTGHIRKRGASSWELKFDRGVDPVTGKRRIHYASFKGTKRQAEIELARLVTENETGGGIDPIKLTVSEFLDRWIRDFAESNVTPKTRERYEQLIRHQIKPNIGAVRIQKLRPVHLSELYAKLLKGEEAGRAPLAPRTVGHCHRLLHRALGHAATWALTQQNVAGLVGPPRVASTEIRTFTQDQAAQLLRHIEGRTLRPIVAVALATGARRGELLALRWQDVDLDSGRIRIARSLEQTKAGGLRFKEPKTRHGRRDIAVPPWIIAELRAHRLKQQRRRMQLGQGRAPDDSLVFARWDGGTRSPNWLTQKFALVMTAMKFDGLTLHCLRHTHASQLIAEGMDILTISRRLGHASPTITLSVYGHLFKNTDDRAAEIMEAAFGKLRP